MKIFIGLLLSVYFGLVYLAANGYGYIGQGGFQNRPLGVYFQKGDIFNSPSVRDGSLGGPGRTGGGPGRGK
ncbi:hypothetical protein LJB99_04810 [Deltaproteobacteria bacterium OttesenSCG-928-K17]|nr:hypothetical protein [Deltaproteobacteria bacterium OttesenSCG-928-K17]